MIEITEKHVWEAEQICDSIFQDCPIMRFALGFSGDIFDTNFPTMGACSLFLIPQDEEHKVNREAALEKECVCSGHIFLANFQINQPNLFYFYIWLFQDLRQRSDFEKAVKFLQLLLFSSVVIYVANGRDIPNFNSINREKYNNILVLTEGCLGRFSPYLVALIRERAAILDLDFDPNSDSNLTCIFLALNQLCCIIEAVDLPDYNYADIAEDIIRNARAK